MITIIFGAGASKGSGSCSPENPPLGNHLFGKLEELKGAYYNLSDGSKRRFRDEGFEAGMATVANDSRVINPLQKELACYLSKFTVEKGNAYIRLFNKLRSCMNQINIVTLNYDLLIEQSLARQGFSVDYNSSGNGISLLKMHGSSNFLPQLPQGTTMSISSDTVFAADCFFEGLETKAVENVSQVEEWCKDPKNSAFSPVLSMYAVGKRVVINQDLIKKIQTKYSESIAASNLVVLVGIKYVPHDTHIWEPIERARPRLLIVDPYPQSTLEWTKTQNMDEVTVLEKGFEEAVWDLTKGIHKAIYLT